MKRFILVVGLFFLIGAVSGCGQSGPLYLPDHPPAKTGSTIIGGSL
ncbi:MAG TPA: lipopeptide [Coxiellaceae bacterium]|nr:lipopeptide [Coxiellaceae bacterium]